MKKASKVRKLVVPMAIVALTPLAKQRVAQAADPANWLTYTSTIAQNWDLTGSWTAGTGVPTSGSGLTINFDPSQPGTATTGGAVSASFTSNNNLGTVTLSTLNLAGSSNSASTSRTIIIAGNTLQFEGSGASITNSTATNGTALVNYTFSAPVALNTNVTLNVNGTGATTFTGGISSTGGARTLTTAGAVVSAGLTFTTTVISNGGGTLGIVHGGAGTLTMGALAHSFTGGLRINSGVVLAGNNANSLGGNTNQIVLGAASGNGSAFDASLRSGNGITYLQPIRVAAGTTNNTLSINQTSNSAIVVFGGLVTLERDVRVGVLGNGGRLDFTGGIDGTGNITVVNAAGTGQVRMSGAGVTINNSGLITNADTGGTGLVISAKIGSAVQGVVQDSATSGLSLAGDNTTMVGEILIKRGAVLGNSNVAAFGVSLIKLGDTSNANSDATTIAAGQGTFTNAINVQSGGTGSATIGTNTNGGVVYSGLATLSKDVNVVAGGSSTMRFSGTVTGASFTGSGNINISVATPAATNVTIGGTNSGFTGNVTLNSGNLKLDQTGGANTSAGALNVANTVYISQGTAIFDLNNNSPTIAGLNDGSGGGGTVTNSSATARSITLGGGGTYAFSGTIASATLSLAKSGSGTQRLSGANTYAGTTSITGGALLVNGAHTGAGNYTVAAGATLGGSGTSLSLAANRTITFNNSGPTLAKLDPGNAGVGSLAISTAAVAGTGGISLTGGEYLWEVGSLTDAGAGGTTGAGTNFDQVSLSGGAGSTTSLTLGGSATLTVAFAGVADPNSGDPFWNVDHTWKIIEVTGTATTTGTFGVSNALGWANGRGFVSFVGDGTTGDTGDVYVSFTAVPEPGSLSLIAATGIGLLARRRRTGGNGVRPAR